MWPLIKFQARTWIQSPSSMFSFITSTMLLLVYAPLVEASNGAMTLTDVMVSVIILNLVSAGIFNFGFTLFELRKSVIMKRIGSTKITKSQAMAGFFLWQIFLAFAIVLYTILLSYILSGGASRYYDDKIIWNSINWGAAVYGLMIGTILSLVIGFFFVSVSKNLEMFNMYSMLYFFAVMFLGGVFIPIPEGSTYNWIEYFGYIIPHTYVMQFMNHAFSGYDVWNLTGYEAGMYFANGVPTTLEIPAWKANMNIWLPLGATIAFAGISTKTFRWDAK